MSTMNGRSAQARYTWVQALYWTIYGLMFGFTTVYFQDMGFPSSAIGLMLGGIYMVSAFLQPALAAFLEKLGMPLLQGIRRVYAVAIALALAALACTRFAGPRCAAMMLMLALQSALQPQIISLARLMQLSAYPVNYGAARGFGSLAFSIATAVFGYVLELVSPMWIPAFSIAAMLAMLWALRGVRLPAQSFAAAPASRGRTSARRSTRSPQFILFLLGACGLALHAALLGGYMIQIVQEIGGGVSDIGLISSIASMVEFPAMLLFARMNHRFRTRTLLVFSGWVWTCKNALILLAAAPWNIYMIQLLQFFGYALYIPASAQYVSEMLPPEENTRGQSLSGSAYTVGCFIAVLSGGFLLDALGVRATLYIAQCASFVGALCLTLSVFFYTRAASGRGLEQR